MGNKTHRERSEKRNNLRCSSYMLKHNRHIETNNKTRKRLIKRKRLTVEILFATLQRSTNRKTTALFLHFCLCANAQKRLIFLRYFYLFFAQHLCHFQNKQLCPYCFIKNLLKRCFLAKNTQKLRV